MRRCSVPPPPPSRHRPVSLPVMYSAIARRSGPPSREPCTRIAPLIRLSRIAAGERGRSSPGVGARESAVPSWQLAQKVANSAWPVDALGASCARAGAATLATTAIAAHRHRVIWRRIVAEACLIETRHQAGFSAPPAAREPPHRGRIRRDRRWRAPPPPAPPPGRPPPVCPPAETPRAPGSVAPPPPRAGAAGGATPP